ncbi:MAG TPA: EpsI family protein [Vicinamibacterales bacterium]|nr:EpsI family protein [Vicinamibacterales bacterium]
MTPNPSPRVLAAAVVGIAALLLCYGGVLASLVTVWSTNYLYSYGFAVPFVAAYVAWTTARRHPVTLGSPDYMLGVPVILVGIALLVGGRLGGLLSIEQASFVVTLTGVVLIVAGRDAVRIHWFTLAYLLLMVPIWSYPIDRLQEPSRLLSARIAASMLHLAGIPALLQNTDIVLSSRTLAVLRECSGVNQLIALTAMVVPAAYVWLDSTARRIALIVFSVVVSYLGNGMRIALVGWLALKGLGDGNPNSSYHLLEGLGVSSLGYLLIGAFFSVLSRPSRETDGGDARPAAVSASVRRRLAIDAALICTLLLGGAIRLSATQSEVKLSNGLATLDNRVGDWTLDVLSPIAAVPLPALDDALVGGYPTADGERRFAAADDEIVRSYRNLSQSHVQLYVGYYNRQSQGKELSGEASDALRLAASPLTLHTGSERYNVSEVVREGAGGSRGVIFWYVINGRIVPDIYRAKGYTIVDAVTRHRTNGAVVMIAWSSDPGTSPDSAKSGAVAFAEALIPVLGRHLPS